MNNDNWVRDMLKERLEAKGIPEYEKFNTFCDELQELFDTITPVPKTEIEIDNEYTSCSIELVRKEGAKEKALELLDVALKKYNIPNKPSKDGVARIDGLTVDEYFKKVGLW
jgi:hypothetical protein